MGIVLLCYKYPSQKKNQNFKKAQSYWATLKNSLKKEGSEIVTKCDNLKLWPVDG